LISKSVSQSGFLILFETIERKDDDCVFKGFVDEILQDSEGFIIIILQI